MSIKSKCLEVKFLFSTSFKLTFRKVGKSLSLFIDKLIS